MRGMIVIVFDPLRDDTTMYEWVTHTRTRVAFAELQPTIIQGSSMS